MDSPTAFAEFAAATQGFIDSFRPSRRALACANAVAIISSYTRDDELAAKAGAMLAKDKDKTLGDWTQFLGELRRTDVWRVILHEFLDSASGADLATELPKLCDGLLQQAECQAPPPASPASPWQEGAKKALAGAPAFGRREEFVDFVLGQLSGFSGPAGGPGIPAALWQERIQAEVRGLPAFERDAAFVDHILSKLAHFSDVITED